MLDLKPDPDDPEVKVLSCNFLPQRGPYNSSMGMIVHVCVC